MQNRPYNRDRAVKYAHRWAYGRNPSYYDFSNIGGDCTNFVSQAIYAGAEIMNFIPTFGWFYNSANDHAPAWTGVEYLYKFLINNQGAGPFAEEVSINEVQTGDIAQFVFDSLVYEHSAVIVERGAIASPDNIFVAAHTFNTDNLPISIYNYKSVRYIHILGVNNVPMLNHRQ